MDVRTFRELLAPGYCNIVFWASEGYSETM